MAAISPTGISADTVYGQQLRQGGEILVLPFTTVGTADTWQAPKAMNPISVAWQPTLSTDQVGPAMNATTKIVTFNSNGGGESGNLIVFCGGKS